MALTLKRTEWNWRADYRGSRRMCQFVQHNVVGIRCSGLVRATCRTWLFGGRSLFQLLTARPLCAADSRKALRGSLYHGSGPSSLNTPAVGPLSGSSARRTGVAAPCSTVLTPRCGVISVAVKPGSAAL